jgi:hypothetical protein
MRARAITTSDGGRPTGAPLRPVDEALRQREARIRKRAGRIARRSASGYEIGPQRYHDPAIWGPNYRLRDTPPGEVNPQWHVDLMQQVPLVDDERYLTAGKLIAPGDEHLGHAELVCLAEMLAKQGQHTQSCVEHVKFEDRGGQSWTRDLQLQLPSTSFGSTKHIVPLGQFGRRHLPDLAVRDSGDNRLNPLTREQRGTALATLLMRRWVDGLPKGDRHGLHKPAVRLGLERFRERLSEFLTSVGEVQNPRTSVSAALVPFYLSLVRMRLTKEVADRWFADMTYGCVELLDGSPYLCWLDAPPGALVNLQVSYTTRDPKHNPDYSGHPRSQPHDAYSSVRADIDRDLGLGPIKHEFDIPSYRHTRSYAFTIAPPEKTSPMFLDWGTGNSLRTEEKTSCSLDSGCLPEDASNEDAWSPWGGRARAFLRVSPHQRVQILAAAALNLMIVLALQDGHFPARLSGPLQGLVLAAPSGLVAYLVGQQRHYYAYLMRKQRAILWGYLTITVSFLVALSFSLQSGSADQVQFSLPTKLLSWALFVSSVGVLVWYLPLGFGFNWVVAAFTRRRWRRATRHEQEWEAYVATYQAYGRLISYGVVVGGLLAIGVLAEIWHDHPAHPLPPRSAPSRLVNRQAPARYGGLMQDEIKPDTATGIRTPVSGLRIRRPSPLDDSGEGGAV